MQEKGKFKGWEEYSTQELAPKKTKVVAYFSSLSLHNSLFNKFFIQQIFIKLTFLVFTPQFFIQQKFIKLLYMPWAKVWK